MRRDLLQFAAHLPLVAVADAELAYQARELFGLLRQRMAGGRRFLDHGGILLRHLIHLIDGGVDLGEAGRLLFRAGRDLRHDRIDLGDLAHDPFQRLAGLPDERDAVIDLLG